MSTDKRLIIAIALSIFIIVMFQIMFPQTRRNKAALQSPSVEHQVASEPFRELTPTELTQKAVTEASEAIVETDRYILTFSNIGGTLRDVKLKDYTDRKTNTPMTLIAGATDENAIFAMKSDSLARALDKQIFNLEESSKNKITYTLTIPNRFKIIKEYHLHNFNNYIELRLSTQNLGTDTIYRDYAIVGASNVLSPDPVMGRRFSEIGSMIDGKIVRKSKVKNGDSFERGIISWTGVKERYFSVILKPLQESEGVVLKQIGKTNLITGVRTKRSPIYDGAVLEDAYILYIGPNDAKILKKLNFGLEQIISYGFFGGISKMLLATLRFFQGITKNWGVAIIMLTLLINIILFPLTKKSFLSMKKIQDVQPHIEKLRTLHKDNPQKMNKELAGVYKQYNINPLGGCLPLLVQMPIFIALYQGLIRSIELKGANFLWIHDLSRPDFVNIPFSLPFLGSQIHILPLLMVVAMFFQQKISAKNMAASSPEQKQQQKLMMIFFPLFFGFLFYNFPSGLVLYWLTNTVLMSIEHSTMRKAHA